MAHVLNDRIKETTTTTGTGNISLAGAETGFETFVSGIGDGNTTYYAISHQTTTEFEIGLGTVNDASPDTITGRTNSNVISSSNSDNVVDFSAGTKDVFCTLPASKAITLDHQSVVNVVGSISLGDSSNRVILSKGSDNQIQFQTEASGQSPVTSNSGATKVYANISAMTATSPTTGDQAFVSANSGLYIFNGGGWYKVATVNTSPTISSPSTGANITLATDGSATTIELVGADVDEGTTLQNSYAVTTGSLTNGGGATATITSSATSDGTYSSLAASTNTTNRFFKVTPSQTQAYAGSFSLTFSMSDGISAATTVQNFTLSFFSQMHVPSGTTMLLGLSFDGSSLGKTGSWNTPSLTNNDTITYYSSGGYNATMAGHAGYASSTLTDGYRISELDPPGQPSKGKTFIIWYKGTQTTSGSAYGMGVPIAADRSIGWSAIGIDDGKICTRTGASQVDRGTTNVADGNWHMLTWVHSDGTHTRLSDNQMGMWVDGSYETAHDIYSGGTDSNRNTNTSFHDLFIVYGSSGQFVQPSRVDAFQIFNSELTDAQILEIYQGG